MDFRRQGPRQDRGAPIAAVLAAPMSPAWRFRTLRRLKGMPKAARMTAGALLVVGGVLGFLPVLGFWMIPLGLLVLAFDVPWLRRRWRAFRAWRNGRRKASRPRA